MELDTEFVEAAIERTRAEITRLEKEREGLAQKLAELREEARLLSMLLELRRTGRASPNLTRPDQGMDSPSSSSHAPRSSTQPAVEASIRELTASGRPLHISDLMRTLRDQQVAIPGAGAQANLIAHLRRDQRIVRPSRGMYGLAEWGLSEMTKPKRSRRNKKKRRIRVHAAERSGT